MKRTGRMRYLSGQVRPQDYDTTDYNATGLEYGLTEVFNCERRGIGYLIKRVTTFPDISDATTSNNPFLVTTYNQRELLKMKDSAGAGLDMVQKILGLDNTGIPPAGNSRVVATYGSAASGSMDGVFKVDQVVVQAVSIGANLSRGVATYYIELEEVELTDDEYVLALLSEQDQDVGNLNIGGGI